MENVGTLVAAPIRVWDDADTYPSAYANELLGGIHQVDDIAARNDLYPLRRKEGMHCVVLDDGAGNIKEYRLEGGIENTDWVELTVTGIQELNGLTDPIQTLSVDLTAAAWGWTSVSPDHQLDVALASVTTAGIVPAIPAADATEYFLRGDLTWNKFSVALALKDLSDVDSSLSPLDTHILSYVGATAQWESITAATLIATYGYWDRTGTTLSPKTAGDNVIMNTSEKIAFRSANNYINSPGVGNLCINANTAILLSIGGTTLFNLTTSLLQPNTDNTISVGDLTHRIVDIFTYNIDASNSLTLNSYTIDTIENTLTDDATRIPTSHAVWDALGSSSISDEYIYDLVQAMFNDTNSIDFTISDVADSIEAAIIYQNSNTVTLSVDASGLKADVNYINSATLDFSDSVAGLTAIIIEDSIDEPHLKISNSSYNGAYLSWTTGNGFEWSTPSLSGSAVADVGIGINGSNVGWGAGAVILADPAADRIVFWDDSASSAEWLDHTFATGGIGIAINATAVGLGKDNTLLADPAADRILFWDDTADALAWLTPGVGLTIVGTTINAAAGSDEYVKADAGDAAGYLDAKVDGTTITVDAVAHDLEVITGDLTLGANGLITIVGGTGQLVTVTGTTLALAFAAKGDLLVGTAANQGTVLTKGTDTHLLVSDSTEVSGLKWIAPNTIGSDAYLSLVIVNAINDVDFTITNGADITAIDFSHAAAHITAGVDEIDGDKLDIDWNPTNYTPATNPVEVNNVDNLTAHLYGIDIQLASGSAHNHNHNDLLNFDGGAPGEYYHFTSVQHTEINAFFDNTNITGAEAETLTDGSNADLLHIHTASGLTYAFTDLSDTPAAYGSYENHMVKVNSAGTGLEFIDNLSIDINSIKIVCIIDEEAGLPVGVTKGEVLYVSGGFTEKLKVSKANNTVAAKYKFFGIANDSGVSTDEIDVVISGGITGLDTSTYSYGDILYMGTNGTFTNVKPTVGTIQIIAYVSYPHATNGTIIVNETMEKDWGVPIGEDYVVHLGGSTVEKFSIVDDGNVERAYFNAAGSLYLKDIYIDSAVNDTTPPQLLTRNSSSGLVGSIVGTIAEDGMILAWQDSTSEWVFASNLSGGSYTPSLGIGITGSLIGLGGGSTILTDPGIDKLYYWNTVTNKTNFIKLHPSLTLLSGVLSTTSPPNTEGFGINITGGAIALGGASGAAADPGTDKIFYWNDGSSIVDFVTVGTGLSFTSGNLVATGAGADTKVAVDNLATAGYLGITNNDGVLRTNNTIDYVDGGDYITLSVDTTYVQGILTPVMGIAIDASENIGLGNATTILSDPAADAILKWNNTSNEVEWKTIALLSEEIVHNSTYGKQGGTATPSLQYYHLTETEHTEVTDFFAATDITGAEAEILTDGSNADSLHVHSTLWTDGTTHLYPTDLTDKINIGASGEPIEMLGITGNIGLAEGANRTIQVDKPVAYDHGDNLIVKAGDAYPTPTIGTQQAGHLYLHGGDVTGAGATVGGNTFLYAGAGDTMGTTYIGMKNTTTPWGAINIGVNSAAVNPQRLIGVNSTTYLAGYLEGGSTDDVIKWHASGYWTIGASPGINDEKVKVSSNDTTADYVINKLTAGNTIDLTEVNDGGDEDLRIDVDYQSGTLITMSDNVSGLKADLNISGSTDNGILTYDSGGGPQLDVESDFTYSMATKILNLSSTGGSTFMITSISDTLNTTMTFRRARSGTSQVLTNDILGDITFWGRAGAYSEGARIRATASEDFGNGTTLMFQTANNADATIYTRFGTDSNGKFYLGAGTASVNDIVSTLANPGTNDNLVTEAAIRSAIGGAVGAADKISEGDTSVECIDSGDDGRILNTANNVQAIRTSEGGGYVSTIFGGNETPYTGVSSVGTAVLTKVGMGTASAVGEVVVIYGGTTVADYGTYIIQAVAANTITLDRVLAGSDADLVLDVVDKGVLIDHNTNSGQGRIILDGGSLTKPSLAFGKGNNGIYESATSQLSLVANAKEVIRCNTAATAVNYFSFTPSATGDGVSLVPDGDDANIDLLLDGKGSGIVSFGGLVYQTGLGDSTYFGYKAGRVDNLTDNRNSGFGYYSLYSNTTGYYNTADGYYSLFSNMSGSRNTADGYASLSSNTTGSYNIGAGCESGRYITAGGANETSSNSIYIGYDTRASLAGNTNEIVIGHGARGAGSNSVTLGHTDIIKTLLLGSVGIGLTPTANMAGLSIEAGLLTLKERATPTADANYGKIYTKNTNKIFFQDGAGVEHEIAFV